MNPLERTDPIAFLLTAILEELRKMNARLDRPPVNILASRSASLTAEGIAEGIRGAMQLQGFRT